MGSECGQLENKKGSKIEKGKNRNKDNKEIKEIMRNLGKINELIFIY